MILMELSLNNFMSFNDFKINLSYPKKISNSLITEEYLKSRRNFRYKKTVILMGANASGKTSLGLMLKNISNFILQTRTSELIEAVTDRKKNATFVMDFLPNHQECTLYRLSVLIEGSEESSSKDPTVKAVVKKETINTRDSYETVAKRIVINDEDFTEDLYGELKKIPHFGFFFMHPTERVSFISRRKDDSLYLKVLETVLRVLDPSVTFVDKVENSSNSYNIHMCNDRNVLVQDGNVVNPYLLSSGTKAGIAVADMLTAIRQHECGFYYCDEKFSYIQSDVEKTILTLMTDMLGEGEQLIFTTHNSDILDIPYPKHSFVFLKKTVLDGVVTIVCINADTYLKRNTDSLRNSVENDLFSTAPDTSLLFNISAL